MDPDPGAVAGEEAGAEQEAETAHHLDRWDIQWVILWVMQSQGASCLLHFTTQYTYDEFDGIHKMYNKDWRNDFWFCPFPIMNTTTSRFLVYCYYPN